MPKAVYVLSDGCNEEYQVIVRNEHISMVLNEYMDISDTEVHYYLLTDKAEVIVNQFEDKFDDKRLFDSSGIKSQWYELPIETIIKHILALSVITILD